MEVYNSQNKSTWSRGLLLISSALVRTNNRIMGSNLTRCIRYANIFLYFVLIAPCFWLIASLWFPATEFFQNLNIASSWWNITYINPGMKCSLNKINYTRTQSDTTIQYFIVILY